jgi:hypothetical protein
MGRYARIGVVHAAVLLANVGCRHADNVVVRGISRGQQLAADRGPRSVDSRWSRPYLRYLVCYQRPNNPAQQTGYFKYDIWDPAGGLNGAHITLDSARKATSSAARRSILPQSGSIFIAGGDNWTGTGTTNTGNNNSNIFRPGDNTLYRETITGTADTVQEHEPGRGGTHRPLRSRTVRSTSRVATAAATGPEVRDLNGNFRLLSSVDTSTLAATFPRTSSPPTVGSSATTRTGRCIT